MAYGRRNFSAYSRVPTAAELVKGEKSLASYRNKTIVFIVATIAYTAFLYSEGVFPPSSVILPSSGLSFV
jgi:hypothetical protein